MKLIELYLEEIRHRLPPRNREDILKEIRSTLMDMLEDRNPESGQSPNEDTIKSVLKAFGSPRQVAREYGARDYLIGPRYYSLYLQILKIVLIIVAGLNILGVIVALVSQPGLDSGIFETIAQIMSDLFSSLFVAFGIVTLSFTGIERTTPEEWTFELDTDWQPEHLIKEVDQERVKVAELAVEITMGFVFIAVLNFFFDRIGIYYLSGTGWVSAPFLNENFQRFIPWITAYVAMDIALALYLIRKGYWDKIGALAKIFINLFKIAVTFAVLSAPGIITIDPSAWQELFSGADLAAQGLSGTLNVVLDVLMGLAILGLAVDSIKRLYLTFIKGSHTGIEIHSD